MAGHVLVWDTCDTLRGRLHKALKVEVARWPDFMSSEDDANSTATTSGRYWQSSMVVEKGGDKVDRMME